eukprot:TRINITY_DN60844_c0_g1_i1.p1 TRINITY_DN60844_c0_g1~~TRINITY_DN60844_c0_g1_i1.p1  ORF type:complete len:972 (-),score=149.93 TRINITY_DN60844_c0_g1_i1:35-2692(-)
MKATAAEEASTAGKNTTWRVGDSQSVLSLDLVERTPATLLLRRRNTLARERHAISGQDSLGRDVGLGGHVGNAVAGSPRGLMTGGTRGEAGARRTAGCGAGGAGGGFSTPRRPITPLRGQQTSQTVPSAIVMQSEAIAQRLEVSIQSKLMEQCADVPPVASTATNCRGDPKLKPARNSLQGYLRDFRAALRLMCPSQITTARVLEGSVKGMVLAMDREVTEAYHTISELEDKLQTSAVSFVELENLRQKEQLLKRQANSFQEMVDRAARRHSDEMRVLQKQVDTLKDELRRVSPESDEVEGVAALVGECGRLMYDMELETAKQRQVLDNLATYTANIARSASGDPSKAISVTAGRVVELANGEMLLRPYDVADAGLQVTPLDFSPCRHDPTSCIYVRPNLARKLLAMFEGRELPDFSQDFLCNEIDKIYNEKISFVAEMEKLGSGAGRRELLEIAVEHFLDSSESVAHAHERVCAILRYLLRAERSQQRPPLKIELFARFLGFCEQRRELPETVLSVALQARRVAQASFERVCEEDVSPAGRGDLQGQPGRRHGNGVATGTVESVISIAAAYDAAAQSLPLSGSVCARRELFVSLCSCAEVKGVEGRRSGTRDFVVFLHLAQEYLQQEKAPLLRDIIARAEARSNISVDDFRSALRETRLHSVEESVWRPRLSQVGTTTMTLTTPLSAELIVEYFGGGSQARLPKAVVGESAFLASVADAVVADYDDRSRVLRRHWERHVENDAGENSHSLQYKDIKALLLSAEPGLQPAAVREIYLSAVEMSRACTREAHDVFPVCGTLEPVKNDFGAEIVTWHHLKQAALRHRLFLEEDPIAQVSPVVRERPTIDGEKPSGGFPTVSRSNTAASGGNTPQSPSIRKRATRGSS